MQKATDWPPLQFLSAQIIYRCYRQHSLVAVVLQQEFDSGSTQQAFDARA